MRTSAQVCIAGGGPAGLMLGLLLARAGIRTLVLEKHADFFRDFRGDTVHPSTLNIIDSLGFRDRFEIIAHRPLERLDLVVNGVRIHAVDFTTLAPPNRLLTLMPQWDLLDLLAEEAQRFPCFELRMGAEVVGVVSDADGRIAGVHACTGDVDVEIRADLTIAADGRASSVRDALGLVPRARGVPADVAWFRLPAPPTGLPDTLAWLSEQGMILTIPRPGYLQCGMLIPKGSFDDVRAAGIDAFRERLATGVPPLRSVTGELRSLDDVKLLSVQIDRLPRWWVPGALCIGDASHAMSPAFGVGINYAIQDAVATANRLVPLIGDGASRAEIDRACAAVQRRRAFPTAMMQQVQRAVHRTIATGRGIRLLENPPTRAQRTVMRLALPTLRPRFARMVGYGFRPERIAQL